jgi:hypothetical protein
MADQPKDGLTGFLDNLKSLIDIRHTGTQGGTSDLLRMGKHAVEETGKGLLDQSENIERREAAMKLIKDEGWLTDKAYATLEILMSHPEGPLHSFMAEFQNQFDNYNRRKGFLDKPGNEGLDFYAPDPQSIFGWYTPNHISLPQTARDWRGERERPVPSTHPNYGKLDGPPDPEAETRRMAETIIHELAHYLDSKGIESARSGDTLTIPDNALERIYKGWSEAGGDWRGDRYGSSTIARSAAEREGVPFSSEDQTPPRPAGQSASTPYGTTNVKEDFAEQFKVTAFQAREDIKAGEPISDELQATLLANPAMREIFATSIPGFNEWLWRTGDLGDDPSVIGEEYLKARSPNMNMIADLAALPDEKDDMVPPSVFDRSQEINEQRMLAEAIALNNDPTGPRGEYGQPPGLPPTRPPRETPREKVNEEQILGEVPRTHIVRKDETLFEIAHKYGRTVHDFEAYNKIEDIDLIHEGALLRIPPAHGMYDRSHLQGRYGALQKPPPPSDKMIPEFGAGGWS